MQRGSHKIPNGPVCAHRLSWVADNPTDGNPRAYSVPGGISDRFSQFGLIVFHRQNVVPTSLDDLFHDLLLATHRIDTHDRAFQFQHLQQLRYRRDFIRLGVNHD